MESKALSTITMAPLLIGMLMSGFNTQLVKAEPPTIIVPDDYPTIQEAINNANEGDTIFVRNGTYYENLIVNKPNLTLIGENRNTTLIDGSQFVVSIEADDVKVSGFTIRNGSVGVRISPWTHGHVISGNIIMNNDEGISGHYDVHNITIHDNIITMNNFVGINLVFYEGIVSDNLISYNGKGDFMELTAGILIGEGINNETISSNNNMVVRNTIKGNYNGIFMTQPSEGNIFYCNTFWNNTHQILLSPSNITLEGNYWSDYVGVDMDGDGIGDTPYIIGVDVKDSFPLMSPFNYWSDPIDGDVNKDMEVDIRDIVISARAFGSHPSHPRWNPQADINQDRTVDIRDLALIARNYGKTWIP